MASALRPPFVGGRHAPGAGTHGRSAAHPGGDRAARSPRGRRDLRPRLLPRPTGRYRVPGGSAGGIGGLALVTGEPDLRRGGLGVERISPQAAAAAAGSDGQDDRNRASHQPSRPALREVLSLHQSGSRWRSPEWREPAARAIYADGADDGPGALPAARGEARTGVTPRLAPGAGVLDHGRAPVPMGPVIRNGGRSPTVAGPRRRPRARAIEGRSRLQDQEPELRLVRADPVPEEPEAPGLHPKWHRRSSAFRPHASLRRWWPALQLGYWQKPRTMNRPSPRRPTYWPRSSTTEPRRSTVSTRPEISMPS